MAELPPVPLLTMCKEGLSTVGYSLLVIEIIVRVVYSAQQLQIHAAYTCISALKTWNCLELALWIYSYLFTNVIMIKKVDFSNINLVGVFFLPLWKIYDFVNWDDDIPKSYGKIKFMATKPPTRNCRIKATRAVGIHLKSHVENWVDHATDSPSQLPCLFSEVALNAKLATQRRSEGGK